MKVDAADSLDPFESLLQLQGFTLFVSAIEDLRTTNLTVPETDFALGVGRLWLVFSSESAPESEVIVCASPSRDQLVLTFERPTTLPDSADVETSEMINRWLSNGQSTISDISASDTNVLFTFTDRRFLAVCGSLEVVGLIVGRSIETYNRTEGRI